MTRRDILALAASAPAWLASSSSDGSAADNPPRMGGAPTAFWQRMQASRASGQPFDMIDHCHGLGLGGVQMNPPSTDAAAIKLFRARLERYQMYLICDPRLPQQRSDVESFEAQVKAYKEAGAVAFHAALTGRRFEDFDSFGPWKTMFEGVQASVELAEPVLRKYQVRLGVENHKGYRAAEQAAWLKRLSSEYVGVCFDFGNNLSLCEHPTETLRTLLPYVFFTHIKDMAVEDYEDGFLLSEVPLGEGILDLKEMARLLRQKDPNIIFELEMITRDPLKIPVFTPKYWATFDDSYSPLPGRDLANTLLLVRRNKPKSPLPRVNGLSSEARVKLEDENNLKCITWGRENLAL
ncbi:MAG TPA: sugar phosphate isomerase/epimerase family protein [Terriglobia bacterium]|nr:sugar phosphate isomerase/epimerase family protein [Terriglobia bacterium]